MTNLAAELWRANSDLASACLNHSFLQGIANGTLPRPSFQAYVAQDAYFLEAFARAYAFALARSPDRHGLETFHELIAGVLNELRLHASYAARWQIDLSGVKPSAATSAYTKFLLSTAEMSAVGEICAAMTPCMRLYAFLGQQLGALCSPTTPYREWIDTYASHDFESLAATLESLLNRYASNNDSARVAYRRAMQLELNFFDAF